MIDAVACRKSEPTTVSASMHQKTEFDLQQINVASHPQGPTALAQKSLLHHISWTLIGNVIYVACQAGWLILISKLSNEGSRGRFVLALSITTPVIFFSAVAMRQMLATDVKHEYPFSVYLRIRLLTTVLAIVVIGGIAAVQWSDHRAAAVVLLLVGTAKAFESISDIIFGRMQQFERLDRVALSMMIKGLISLIMLAIGLAVTHDAVGAAAGIAISFLITLLLIDIPSARLVTKHAALSESHAHSARNGGPWFFSGSSGLQLVRGAAPLAFASGLVVLNPNILIYFIRWSSGERTEELVGVYGSLSYLAQIGTIVVAGAGHGRRNTARVLFCGWKDSRVLPRALAARGFVFCAGGAGCNRHVTGRKRSTRDSVSQRRCGLRRRTGMGHGRSGNFLHCKHPWTRRHCHTHFSSVHRAVPDSNDRSNNRLRTADSSVRIDRPAWQVARFNLAACMTADIYSSWPSFQKHSWHNTAINWSIITPTTLRINRTLDARSMKPPRISGSRAHFWFCAASFRPGARILDLGCGVGFLLNWLARRPGIVAVGVDASASQLEIARANLPNVEFSGEDWNTCGQIPNRSTGFFADVLEHIPGTDLCIEWVQTARAALRPGGFFVCRRPNGANLTASYSRYIDLTHERIFTEVSILQLLEAGGLSGGRVLPIRAGSLGGRTRIAVEAGLHRMIYRLCGQGQVHHFTYNVFAVGYRSD